MRGRLLRPTLVIDVDRGMVRRPVRVDEHGWDAVAVQHRKGLIVWAQAEADEAVDGGLPDRALQGSVDRRHQEQGQVVLLALFAEALDELAQERVGEDCGQALRDQEAYGSAAPHGEGTR